MGIKNLSSDNIFFENNNKKFLCIDFGLKKSGFAISCDAGVLAFPQIVFFKKNNESKNSYENNLFLEIYKICKEKKIKNLVFGESVNVDGSKNKIHEDIKLFAEKILENFKKENFPINIFFEKEWFSTVEARRFENVKNSDASAAAIILQRFLDKLNKKN